MSHILRHFSLEAAKWNGMVLLALIVIWAGVLTCAVSSILAQQFDRKQRIFWVCLVILLPFLGVLSYLPFAFRKEELPHIFLRKSKRPKKNRPEKTGADS